MKTQIKKNGDTFIVTMTGKLSFEGQGLLRESLTSLLKNTARLNKTDSTPGKFIFDFGNLEFVGSMGIATFVQTLKDFTERSPQKPKYCNVASEFQKVIKAYDEAHLFEFFNDEREAISSFNSTPEISQQNADAVIIPEAKIPSA